MNINLNVTYLYHDEDNKVGVVIKYKDFEKLMARLEDLHDIYEVYKRKSKSSKTISVEKLKEELFGV